MTETPISPRVAKACAEVAKNDLDRIRSKEHKFIPPYSHKEDGFTLTEWFHRQQDERVETAKARLEKYRDLAKKK